MHRFIRNAFMEGGRVLVHCHAGISRSATTVISYLMSEHGLLLNAALQFVRNKRWFINPNPGFIKQLQSFERELLSQRDRTNSIFSFD